MWYKYISGGDGLPKNRKGFKMSDTKKMLSESCNEIAEDLDAITRGEMVRDENGESVRFDEAQGAEDAEPFDMYDYLEDVYDIRYMMDSEGCMLGAQLLVAFGGPNIWVDTAREEVSGDWWGCSAVARISKETADAIEEALSELFELTKERRAS